MKTRLMRDRLSRAARRDVSVIDGARPPTHQKWPGLRWVGAALALALVLLPIGAWAQYPPTDTTTAPSNPYLGPGPFQGLQQQQQTAPSGPARDVMGIVNPSSTTGVTRPGESTQAEGGPTVQAPISETERPAVGAVQPFGASLFTGTSPASSDAPNPAYRIQTGDKVEIRVWGGFDADTTAPVDPEGNVFLAGVGPIHVAGVAASELQGTIERSIRNVFTQKVYVYAVLVTTHRVAAYVTGYVRRPGRYTGSASDSVLDYLVRAGGVDPARGSYRDITVHRKDQILAVVDLYRFLIAGTLPAVDLREGDTIIVGRQHAMVSVDGAVRNSFLFEMLDNQVPGRSVIELSRPGT
jgi:protein involved in polysaccharide export with SLBB domain